MISYQSGVSFHSDMLLNILWWCVDHGMGLHFISHDDPSVGINSVIHSKERMCLCFRLSTASVSDFREGLMTGRLTCWLYPCTGTGISMFFSYSPYPKKWEMWRACGNTKACPVQEDVTEFHLYFIFCMTGVYRFLSSTYSNLKHVWNKKWIHKSIPSVICLRTSMCNITLVSYRYVILFSLDIKVRMHSCFWLW